MSEEKEKPPENQPEKNQDNEFAHVRPDQLSYKDYLALKEQEKEKKAKAFKMPKIVKMLLAAPLYLLFLAGLFIIPLMLYLMMQDVDTKGDGIRGEKIEIQYDK